MCNRNKAEAVVGTIPRKYGWLAQKRHASTYRTTLEAIDQLVYKLSKLRLRAHSLMGF